MQKLVNACRTGPPPHTCALTHAHARTLMRTRSRPPEHLNYLLAGLDATTGVCGGPDPGACCMTQARAGADVAVQALARAPYPALPCPTLPCPTLPCPALPCPTLPYPTFAMPKTRRDAAITRVHAWPMALMVAPSRNNAPSCLPPTSSATCAGCRQQGKDGPCGCRCAAASLAPMP